MTSPGGSLGALFVEVRPGTSRFEPELSAATVRAGNEAADKAGPGMGRRLAGHIGQALAVGTGVLAVGLVKGIGAAVRQASDLNETISKTQVVFGSSSKEIIDWSKTTATSIGQSQKATLDAAATFAIYGKSAGLSGQANVNFSKGLVKLASDMASFSNTSPEEAIDAIGAAMRGETDPIEKYGILLNDTTLRHVALEHGIVNTTKNALTPQQRVLATQAALFEQLGKAGSGTIGDFQRTSAGLANQTRITQATLTNLGAEIGTAFLPIVGRLVQTFNTRVIPALQRTWQQHGPQLVAFLTTAAPRFERWAASIDQAKIDSWLNNARQAFAAAQPVIQRFFQNFQQGGGQGISDTIRVTGVAMRFLANNADVLARALPALVTLFVAYKTAQLAANVAGVADPFIKIASAVATNRLAKANRELAGALRGATVTQVAQNVTTGEAAVEETVLTGAKTRGRAATILSTVATRAMTIAQQVATIAARGLGIAFRFMLGPVGLIITAIGLATVAVIYLYKHNETARKIIDGAWKGIRTAVTAVANWITGTIWPSLKKAYDQGAAAVRFLASMYRAEFNIIRTVVTTVVGAVISTFNRVRSFITVTLPAAFRAGVGAITNAWNRVKEAAAAPVRFVINTVFAGIGGVFNRIAGFLHLPDAVRFPALRANFDHGGRFSGRLPGPNSSRDNMLGYGPRGEPVGLAGGEFIVNAGASERHLALLEAINSGRSFAFGGLLDFLKSPINFVKDKVSGIVGQISGRVGSGPFGSMLSGLAGRIRDGVIDRLQSFIGSFIGGSGRTKGGGIFGPWPVSPAAQRGDSGIWRRIVALIRATGPISGSFGNGYRAGDPLWHGSGRAVDWMGYNQDRLASYLANLGPLELIHRSNSRDYAYTRGRNMGSFNNALMQAHRNHVHIAFAGGGRFRRFDTGGLWPTGTVGVNTSGRTETVTPGQTMDDAVEVLMAILAAVQDVPGGFANALARNSARTLQAARGYGSPLKVRTA
jgi:hypothetical protein